MNLKGKRIVITGGSGFLGYHLGRKLGDMGITPCSASSSNCDLRDERATLRFFNEKSPEVVFHLAARCGGIGANMVRPADFITDNLRINTNVLDATMICGCEKIILVGSVCSYPSITPDPFQEENLWNGYPEETNAPYGIAKRAMLVQAQAYRKQYGLNAIYLIPANMYGPHDNFDLETSHVIPALIRKFSSGDDSVAIWGDGTPTREFLYAEDAADALIQAAEHYDGAEPVNVGTGCEVSIRVLAEMIASLCGYKGNVAFDRSRPNGQMRRVLDIVRAYDEFGWTAKTMLESGLKKTIEWYSKHLKPETETHSIGGISMIIDEIEETSKARA